MSQSVAELNAQTDSALAARAADAAKVPAPKPVTPKRPSGKKPVTPKPAPKPAPVVKATRKPMTPKERAAKPVTATIAAYVEWLDRNRILGSKPMTGPEKRAAGIAITLYGSYQTSPERKLARDGKA